MFLRMLEGMRHLIFPDNCFLCKTFLNNNHHNQLCTSCLNKIVPNVPPFCMRCSKHLNHFTEDSLCETCSQAPLAIDHLWGCCLYEEPLSQLIYDFKYRGKTMLRKTFATIMHDFIVQYHVPIHEFDIIVPIPLHPVRLRERGYNQAALLSENLSVSFGLTHEPDLLKRIKPAISQTQLSQKQRWTNVQGAFKMNSSKSIADKSILLVDDLLTTKATANAAATALKLENAAHVGIITLAIV